LAREPAADGVDGKSIPSKSVACEVSDVFIARDFRPVFVKNAATVRGNFAKRYRPERAAAFKSEAKPANTTEEVKQPHRHRETPVSKGRIRTY
jgi:hypothetical protein